MRANPTQELSGGLRRGASDSEPADVQVTPQSQLCLWYCSVQGDGGEVGGLHQHHQSPGETHAHSTNSTEATLASGYTAGIPQAPISKALTSSKEAFGALPDA